MIVYTKTRLIIFSAAELGAKTSKYSKKKKKKKEVKENKEKK